MTFAALKSETRGLYKGATPRGVRFRYALLAFDIVTVLFIIATSFLPSSQLIETFDVLFGIGILADFAARLLASRHRLREFTRFSTWTDVIAIVSFLAPLAGAVLGLPAYPAHLAAAARLPDAGAAARRQLVVPGATRRSSSPSPTLRYSSS